MLVYESGDVFHLLTMAMPTFARLVEMVIEAPMTLSLWATDSAGLSTAQACIACLAVFVAMTPPLYSIVRRGLLPAPVLLAVFYVWMAIGMGVECRSELNESNGAIVDIGHDTLAPLNRYLNSAAGATLNTAGAILNTVYVFSIFAYATWTGLVQKRPGLLLTGIVSGAVRMTVGVATRLPAPQGYVATDGDWPPPSDTCAGFIFNPSGHVMQSALVSLSLRRTGGAAALHAARLVDLTNLAQAIRLIATRGHFTVDIITAILIALVVDEKVAAWQRKAAAAAPEEDAAAAFLAAKEH